jgi:hypothetical protein
MAKRGRPSSYTQAIADEICERIATQPRGIDRICDEDADMPTARTVHSWLNQHEDFLQSYLRAKERQADLLFDQALTIADTPLLGEIVTVEKGNEDEDDGTIVKVRREDMLGHRTLQVNTRMRMAGKLHPKKYGDKLDLTSGGEKLGLSTEIEASRRRIAGGDAS